MNTALTKEKSAFAADHDNIVYLPPDLWHRNTQPRDENTDTDSYADQVWESIMKNCASQAMRDNFREIITPRQRKLTMMRADGYSDREIAHYFGVRPYLVKQEIEAACSTVRTRAPELLDLIAA